MSPHYLVKCKTFTSVTAGNVAFFQMLVTLKRASCGLALVALKMTEVCMNDTAENDLFGFPKVKWLQYTGKVGKCTSC